MKSHTGQPSAIPHGRAAHRHLRQIYLDHVEFLLLFIALIWLDRINTVLCASSRQPIRITCGIIKADISYWMIG